MGVPYFHLLPLAAPTWEVVPSHAGPWHPEKATQLWLLCHLAVLPEGQAEQPGNSAERWFLLEPVLSAVGDSPSPPCVPMFHPSLQAMASSVAVWILPSSMADASR